MIGQGNKLPDSTKDRIRKLHGQGVRAVRIAESVGVSRRTVYRAIQPQKPKDDLTESQNSGQT